MTKLNICLGVVKVYLCNRSKGLGVLTELMNLDAPTICCIGLLRRGSYKLLSNISSSH